MSDGLKSANSWNFESLLEKTRSFSEIAWTICRASVRLRLLIPHTPQPQLAFLPARQDRSRVASKCQCVDRRAVRSASQQLTGPGIEDLNRRILVGAMVIDLIARRSRDQPSVGRHRYDTMIRLAPHGVETRSTSCQTSTVRPAIKRRPCRNIADATHRSRGEPTRGLPSATLHRHTRALVEDCVSTAITPLSGRSSNPADTTCGNSYCRSFAVSPNRHKWRPVAASHRSTEDFASERGRFHPAHTSSVPSCENATDAAPNTGPNLIRSAPVPASHKRIDSVKTFCSTPVATTRSSGLQAIVRTTPCRGSVTSGCNVSRSTISTSASARCRP